MAGAHKSLQSQCVHCYAESSPFRAGDDLLEPEDYRDVLSTAAQLGCRQVQFIGGEPTVNRHLPDFIAHARSLNSQFVEVFTNLTRVRTVVLPFLRAGVPAVALIEEMIIQPGLLSRRLAMNCQWPLQY